MTNVFPSKIQYYDYNFTFFHQTCRLYSGSFHHNHESMSKHNPKKRNEEYPPSDDSAEIIRQELEKAPDYATLHTITKNSDNSFSFCDQHTKITPSSTTTASNSVAKWYNKRSLVDSKFSDDDDNFVPSKKKSRRPINCTLHSSNQFHFLFNH